MNALNSRDWLREKKRNPTKEKLKWKLCLPTLMNLIFFFFNLAWVLRFVSAQMPESLFIKACVQFAKLHSTPFLLKRELHIPLLIKTLAACVFLLLHDHTFLPFQAITSTMENDCMCFWKEEWAFSSHPLDNPTPAESSQQPQGPRLGGFQTLPSSWGLTLGQVPRRHAYFTCPSLLTLPTQCREVLDKKMFILQVFAERLLCARHRRGSPDEAGRAPALVEFCFDYSLGRGTK